MRKVESVEGCSGCPLQKLYPENTFVEMQQGKLNRLGIGEAPGRDEAEAGKPFVGGSGTWLKILYSKAGINKDDVNFINCIQCRPKDNIYPTDSDAKSYIDPKEAKKAVDQCWKNHVQPVLDSRKWARIDLLGAKALEAATGLTEGIYQWRGSPLVIEGQGEKPVAIATLHPAAIMRDQTMIAVTINDLRKSLQQPPEYYNLHPSIAEVKAFTSTEFAYDIETAYFWGDSTRITMVGLSDRLYHAMVVPFQGPYQAELKRIFKNAESVVSWNGLQFDQPILDMNGVKLSPSCQEWDAMILHHLRFPDLPHSLGFAGSMFSGKGFWKEDKKDFEKYCLTGDSLVLTATGTRQISKIRAGEQVLSWSEKIGNHYKEVKKVLKQRDSKVRWLSVKVDGTLFRGGKWGKHVLKVTPDHLIRTQVGWREAQDLESGDRILLPRTGADDLIQGTLLGDSYTNRRARLTCSQANEDYAKRKAVAFGTEARPHGKKGHWEFEVGIPEHWRKLFYRLGGKRFVPPISDRALAIWYCDDGCYANQSGPRIACPASFGQDVISWFKNRFGEHNVSKYNDTGQCFSVALKVAANDSFYSAICKYVPPSMQYKLPLAFRGKYNGWLEQQEPQWGFVDTVTSLVPKRRGLKQMRYCLEVPGTHCFYTVDGLVHNCARDTDVTLQIFRQLKPMIEQEKLMDLYKLVQVPLAKICKHLSDTGIKIDPNRIEEVRERIKAEVVVEERLLPESLRSYTRTKKARCPNTTGLVGKSGKLLKYGSKEVEEIVNPWASSTVVQKYLYEELGLEPVKDLKTNNITSGKMALDKLYNKTKNPAIKAIKSLRKKASMLNLFAKEDLKKSATVHTHFNVHGTASGRLSSSDPNLQNITEAAKYLYVPRHEGWSLAEFDFSQIENRLTAWFANDTDRLGRFLADPAFSEHKWAAATIFDLDYADIEKDNDKDAAYGRGKRINHGSGYGLGAKKLSMMYDLPFVEVKRQQDKLKSAMPLTCAWQARTGGQAKREGFLTTPFNRKRWFWTSSVYTESLSFLPQSTAADIIFRAMLGLMYDRIGWPLEQVQKVVRYVEALPAVARLLLTVHDSLLFETPDELLPNLVGTVTRVMTQGWPELGGFNIPVECKVGKSWGEMRKYTGPIA